MEMKGGGSALSGAVDTHWSDARCERRAVSSDDKR